MQVILLKDVAKVGRQFDIKTVADGFALNFLFPRGLAELATKEKVAALETKRSEIAHMQEIGEQALTGAIKKLDGATVSIKAGKASESGSLYKGIGAEAVAEALSKAAGAKISTDVFDLAHPIKTVGEHSLALNLGTTKATCTLVVVAGEK
ncbi:MAG: 50S ribosomal protein L9 [Parcubacteria group bacterium]|nr:50S ribosomal protein L9 [Parcubacteria group bacterium]